MRTTSNISEAWRDADSSTVSSSLPSLFLPERIPADWAIAIGLFMLATGYSLIFPRYGIDPDEGTILQGAQRVLNGQIPYRDFFCLFTPGSFYFYALLFKAFGNSINVARSAVSVYGGLFAALTYLVARRVCARWSALLTALLFSVAIFPVCLFALHNWDSTLWAYLALYCAIWFLQRPHGGWALAMGTFCSMTVLFEQSKGVGLLLGLLAAFVILSVCHRLEWKRTQMVAAIIGLIWPVAVTLAYFAAHRSLYPLIVDLVHPLIHYSTVNKVPYGFMAWGETVRSAIVGGPLLNMALILLVASPFFLISALPIFAAAILVYSSIRGCKTSQGRAEHWCYYVLASACGSGLLLSVIVTRKDFSHFVYIAPIVSVVLSWILDDGSVLLPSPSSLRPWLVVIFVLAFSSLGLTELLNARALIRRQTRRGMINLTADETAFGYLQAHTQPGEQIFVYPYSPSYYYLSATSNPTEYDFLQPGYHTPQQFQRALRQILIHRPRVVLFDPAFYENILLTAPSTPAHVLASRDPVSDFVLKDYKPCSVLTANTGRFVFMVRNDLTCPQMASKSQSSPTKNAKRSPAS